MPRSNFIKLQQASIFTVDGESMVQADSVALQTTFREIYEEEQFDAHLQVRWIDLISLK